MDIPGILFVRHLMDQNALVSFGLDGNLILGQESAAQKITQSLLEFTKEHNHKTLLLFTSPMRRTSQTADIIFNQIQKGGRTAHIIVRENLMGLKQAQMILPLGYQDGDTFEGLAIAKQIFDTEKFNPDDSACDNLTYRHGDPVMLPTGKYRYPELIPYFSSPGENYGTFLLRVYSELLLYCQYFGQYEKKYFPVVFTHNLLYFILRDLEVIAEKILNDHLVIPLGQLYHVCFGAFNRVERGGIPDSHDADFGRISFLSTRNLLQKEVIDLLEREIDFLTHLTANN